jgi:1,4-dihydroxy-2-naphthoate octaprenyltransferase
MIALVTAVPFLGILLFCLAIAPLVRHAKNVTKETTLEVQMVYAMKRFKMLELTRSSSQTQAMPLLQVWERCLDR